MRRDGTYRCGSCCCQPTSINACLWNFRGLLRVTKGSNTSFTIYIHIYWRTGRHFRRCNVRAVEGDFFDISRCVILTPFLSLPISTTLLRYLHSKKVPNVNLWDTMMLIRERIWILIRENAYTWDESRFMNLKTWH